MICSPGSLAPRMLRSAALGFLATIAAAGGISAAQLEPFADQVPIGVIGLIYESRPNVAADAGAQLLLQLGNLIVGERVRARHLGRRLTAVTRGELTEGADDRGQLAQATVFGEDAEKVLGGLVDAEFALSRSIVLVLVVALVAAGGGLVSTAVACRSSSARSSSTTAIARPNASRERRIA